MVRNPMIASPTVTITSEQKRILAFCAEHSFQCDFGADPSGAQTATLYYKRFPGGMLDGAITYKLRNGAWVADVGTMGRSRPKDL